MSMEKKRKIISLTLVVDSFLLPSWAEDNVNATEDGWKEMSVEIDQTSLPAAHKWDTLMRNNFSVQNISEEEIILIGGN